KILKRKLTEMGVNVILTRSDDRFLSLAQRADIANSTECDFFISIHANASKTKWATGVEVFYLSETADDNPRSYNASQRYNSFARETYSGQNTEAILWDLKFTENRRQSISLAKCICSAVSAHLSQKNRGSKPAKFFVLKTNVPAILIEVGFLTNTWEEKQLRDHAYREKIASGIMQGISRYNTAYTQSYVRN
ncbi:MAG: N-acetylmuramoyl-L-alanine amidase, partial [Candidatus Omnitrophota bacterium]